VLLHEIDTLYDEMGVVYAVQYHAFFAFVFTSDHDNLVAFTEFVHNVSLLS